MTNGNARPQPMFGSPVPPAGSRVVLTCRSNLSFCGTSRGTYAVGAREGLLVETDAGSGLAVWCPVDFVQQVRVIPIDPAVPDGSSDVDGP